MQNASNHGYVTHSLNMDHVILQCLYTRVPSTRNINMVTGYYDKHIYTYNIIQVVNIHTFFFFFYKEEFIKQKFYKKRTNKIIIKIK